MLFPDTFAAAVTIPVAPVASGIKEHFMSPILWISICKFLYLSLLSASLLITLLSSDLATLLLLLLLLLFGIDFMHDIYNYIPETMFLVLSVKVVKKFPAFRAVRRFIIAFTRSCLSLSRATSII
jgi:hypothetical protein